VGWYGDAAATTGARYNPVAQSRILDTRAGNGAPVAKLGAGATLDLQVTGRGGVPATGATAVALDVTVLQPSSTSSLTVWPTGQARPNPASSVTYGSNQSAANVVLVPLGTGGKVSLYNQYGSTHVVADVVGWYGDAAATTGARFNQLAQARILDTRSGNGAPVAKLGTAATLDLQVTGRGGVPATGATAVALHVTVLQPSTASSLTAWPTGQVRPNPASNLTYASGQSVTGLVLVPLGAGGKVSLYNQSGTTNVTADVVGWYGP
ncbi:MAG TPA: hypothetical protein VHE80_01535, partial [Acidimicrobiales bacterium]|nr:hypothetical protein [Acidimicrobiales bacterium]